MLDSPVIPQALLFLKTETLNYVTRISQDREKTVTSKLQDSPASQTNVLKKQLDCHHCRESTSNIHVSKSCRKTRMDKIRNEEIRQVCKHATSRVNKNKIRWWSHVKRMAPTALQSRALVIQPVGKRPRGRPQNSRRVRL